MTTDRKYEVITLYGAGHEMQLADLWDQTVAAQEAEEAEPQRFASKSKAIELAKKYDRVLAEAEEAARKVTIWQVSYLEWGPLAEMHPPREGELLDRQQGLNRKTFPSDLLKVALVEPDQSSETSEPDIADLLERGAKALASLGHLSQPQYINLETTSWNLSAGDDSRPKSSLVSLLKQQRDQDSRQQLDSE